MEKYLMVEVSWVDITTHHGWKQKSDGLGEFLPEPHVTVGYLLSLTNEICVVTGTVGAEQWCDVTVIPTGVITSMEVLRG